MFQFLINKVLSLQLLSTFLVVSQHFGSIIVIALNRHCCNIVAVLLHYYSFVVVDRYSIFSTNQRSLQQCMQNCANKFVISERSRRRWYRSAEFSNMPPAQQLPSLLLDRLLKSLVGLHSKTQKTIFDIEIQILFVEFPNRHMYGKKIYI